MTSELIAHPELDAVHCLSVRVAADGTFMTENYLPPTGDLFPTLACRVAFHVHDCVVRRSLVEAVGRFDPSLQKCPDWDLWQRIARTGARFGAVREVLTFYRMSPNSASLDAHRMLEDSLRILKQGHSRDPRVPNPHPDYANGLPPEQVRYNAVYMLCWCAGLLLGSGKDARSLLDVVRGDFYPEIDPHSVASCIFESTTLPTCQTLDYWEELWSGIRPHLENFLIALEAEAMTPGLARRATRDLRKMILNQSLARQPGGARNDRAIEKRQALIEELKHIEDLRESKWSLRVAGGNIAKLVFPPEDPDGMRITIEKAGTKTSYDIQLNQPRLKARPNHGYRVQFRARADRLRSIFIGFAQAHEPWNNLGLYKEIALTSEWQSFQEEFTATEDDDNGRIHFDLGGSNISVELSEVVLRGLPDDREESH